MLVHKSLVLPRGDAQQCGPGLGVMRMALRGGGNENGRIEENIQWGYAFKTDSIRSWRTSSRMRSQFAPGSGLPRWTHRPSTLTMEGRCSARLRSTPSGCSIATSAVSGLKPSRSRRGLGTTIRPALSILTSIPSIVPYAIDYGDGAGGGG